MNNTKILDRLKNLFVAEQNVRRAVMPNFLVIGANKAGTTALYNYLKQHPEVYMSPVKEPLFFSLIGKEMPDKDEKSHKKTLKEAIGNIEDYQALFNNACNEKAVGEASTSYLHCPWSADSIKEYLPGVKIIAILRNPVERAYSNYLMYVRWGVETLTDFSEAIREEENRIKEKYPMGYHYVRLGFYYEPMKHYFELFPRDQIRVYLYEDWNARPLEIIKDIFRFIGVDDAFTPDMSVRHNAAGIPEEKMPPLTEQTRKYLIEVYREDIVKLQALIGRDLSGWLE